MTNNVFQLSKAFMLVACAVLPISAVAQSSEKSLPEGVVASVNGRPIPQMSIDAVTQQISEAGQDADPQLILDELINLEILTQAAEGINLDKEPEISSALQLQYTQTMANAYLARKGAEMSFTDEELRLEYEAQSANVDLGEFKASHILLESEAKAQEVLAELNAGKTFSDAAAEHSLDPSGANGGDLGWFVGATMVTEFADAIADMDVGETSKQPVKSEFGYHIISLMDKRNAALPDFNSVKDGLANLAVRKALAKHVEELKASANIKTQ